MNIRSLFPEKTRLLFRQIRLFFPLLKNVLYWFGRDLRYSNILDDEKTRLKQLIIRSHVLEKGLTMPSRRNGFGYERVRDVMNLCKLCITQYGEDHDEIQITLDALAEYHYIHKSSNFALPDDIETGIIDIIRYRKRKDDICSLHFNNELYFKKYASFEEFAKSRHTCRHFINKTIDVEILKHCVSIAQTAPSACNRQSVKVYAVSSEKNKKIVLSLQNGNRGFGEYADQILLITSDQRCWDMKYRSSAYIDAGIMTMNLLYALHENNIAACTLNAHLSPKQIMKLHKDLDIPVYEIPVVFIAIGYAPNDFFVARSRRVRLSDVFEIR